MKKLLALVLALCMVLALAACGGENPAGTSTGTPAGTQTDAPAGTQSGTQAEASAEFEEMDLTLALATALTHPHTIACEQFAEEVSEKTGGKVNITVYPASELGDQPALIESCYVGGDVDIVVASQANAATYMPKLNAIAAPFLFADYDHAHRVMDAYVLDWINLDVEEQMHMHALALFDYGFRHVTTKDIEVSSAADMAGLKIRVPGSAGLLATFDALGCNTQTIAYAELYQSLQQGVCAAQENPVATILADSLYDVQNNLFLTGHYFDVQLFLVNSDLWKSFSPELQAVFTEAAMNAQQVTRDLISGGEADTIAELESKGMTVYEVDRQSFVDAMAPAYDAMAELCGQEEMDALLEAAKAQE